MLPEIKTAINASDAVFGIALLFSAIGALPAMLFTGAIVKKFNRWTLSLSLFAFAITTLLLSFVDSPFALAGILFLIGAASGALDVIMNAGVATLEEVTGKKYFNIAHAAFPLAVIVASPGVGLARQFGIDCKVIITTLTLFICLAAFFCLWLEAENR